MFTYKMSRYFFNAHTGRYTSQVLIYACYIDTFHMSCFNSYYSLKKKKEANIVL